MKIVGIGGGTGLPVLLSGLRELRDDALEPFDITAIVTVADNGGSTGALREAFDMPAMGDIRKCMIALAPENSVLSSVCAHRFDNPESFAGHSLGNLILSALYLQQTFPSHFVRCMKMGALSGGSRTFRGRAAASAECGSTFKIPQPRRVFWTC